MLLSLFSGCGGGLGEETKQSVSHNQTQPRLTFRNLTFRDLTFRDLTFRNLAVAPPHDVVFDGTVVSYQLGRRSALLGGSVGEGRVRSGNDVGDVHQLVDGEAAAHTLVQEAQDFGEGDVDGARHGSLLGREAPAAQELHAGIQQLRLRALLAFFPPQGEVAEVAVCLGASRVGEDAMVGESLWGARRRHSFLSHQESRLSRPEVLVRAYLGSDLQIEEPWEEATDEDIEIIFPQPRRREHGCEKDVATHLSAPHGFPDIRGGRISGAAAAHLPPENGKSQHLTVRLEPQRALDEVAQPGEILDIGVEEASCSGVAFQLGAAFGQEDVVDHRGHRRDTPCRSSAPCRSLVGLSHHLTHRIHRWSRHVLRKKETSLACVLGFTPPDYHALCVRISQHSDYNKSNCDGNVLESLKHNLRTSFFTLRGA